MARRFLVSNYFLSAAPVRLRRNLEQRFYVGFIQKILILVSRQHFVTFFIFYFRFFN